MPKTVTVALRKESVDRNLFFVALKGQAKQSLSARRAWIETAVLELIPLTDPVALRKESVDRNTRTVYHGIFTALSLSARRAWIETYVGVMGAAIAPCRSPQGERG